MLCLIWTNFCNLFENTLFSFTTNSFASDKIPRSRHGYYFICSIILPSNQSRGIWIPKSIWLSGTSSSFVGGNHNRCQTLQQREEEKIEAGKRDILYKSFFSLPLLFLCCCFFKKKNLYFNKLHTNLIF